jgi:hypothetical protein
LIKGLQLLWSGSEKQSNRSVHAHILIHICRTLCKCCVLIRDCCQFLGHRTPQLAHLSPTGTRPRSTPGEVYGS